MRYDVVVVGAEPAGLRYAHGAARQRLRVALLTPSMPEGGLGFANEPRIVHDLAEVFENRKELLPTVIPARTQFAQFSRHFRDLCHKDRERQVSQLQDLGVQHRSGRITLLGPHSVGITESDQRTTVLQSERIVLASPSSQRATWGIRCDGHSILSGDQILGLTRLPRRIAVVGAGMLGMAWADLLSGFGAEITVIDGDSSSVGKVTERMADRWRNRLQERSLRLVSGSDAIGLDRGSRRGMAVILECGLRIATDVVLAAHGRQLSTAEWSLENLGLMADERGRLWSDSSDRTAVPSILAAGQTISHPEARRYLASVYEEHSPPVSRTRARSVAKSSDATSIAGEQKRRSGRRRVPVRTG